MARSALFKNPKFLRLIAELRRHPGPVAPEVMAVGVLETLWQIAYESVRPCLGSARDVELFAGWTGPAGELVRMLVEAGGEGHAGFLDLREGRYYVHDLFDHAPQYVRRRFDREEARSPNGAPPSSTPTPPAESQKPDDPPAPAKPRGSRRVPEEFDLTPERFAFAKGMGLSETRVIPNGQETICEIELEFDKMCAHEFPRAYTDWDAVWQNWVRTAAKGKLRRVTA